MSKKHFIALADHLREYQEYGTNKFSERQISSIADFCQSQNSNFNRERWLDYIAGKCGPNGGRK